MPQVNTECDVKRCACYYSGRVQGVGFRYTVHNIALQHAVRGFVRNLPDGRVEVVVEGAEGEIEQVCSEICDRMDGFIHHVDISNMAPTGEFRQFSIRH